MAVLTTSKARAQQADQAPAAGEQTPPKKKTKKKKSSTPSTQPNAAPAQPKQQ
jgi:hypothetical protein